jgi:hypothetical protein
MQFFMNTCCYRIFIFIEFYLGKDHYQGKSISCVEILYGSKRELRGTICLGNNIINLYVDDLRDCPSGFTIARDVNDAIHYLENYKIHLLSLDHDLGEDLDGNLLPTGYDLVKYIVKKGYGPTKFTFIQIMGLAEIICSIPLKQHNVVDL